VRRPYESFRLIVQEVDRTVRRTENDPLEILSLQLSQQRLLDVYFLISRVEENVLDA
jgi:hypothetical protein